VDDGEDREQTGATQDFIIEDVGLLVPSDVKNQSYMLCSSKNSVAVVHDPNRP